ncbi:MAG TPA: DUF5856 family protein [Burkholderiales bacterium]|nr:DUF5856 family protein [Burkholderiales bacterium]
MKDIYLSKLLHSEIQTHIFHLQIQDLAPHLALGDFYSSLAGLNDSLIEQCQGTHDMIYVNYNLEPIINLSDNPKLTSANIQTAIVYLSDLMMFLKENKLNVFSEEDTHLLNLLDEIISLIATTLYKLKYLK